ncbi:hypothetical protein DZF91_22260 [Actinomadura logoneensis]|uniref:CobQ/CobB/MinD/ParA nucleotide binding domain-containing protein n=1 Tax=Actinomadura logoneensis TaxID=2293572 RepID=A0A372JHI4_9ACTN|nr:AAA family ATPase [Actinomadura logoneensis]RFU39482.1 hypothetical protein DZF91_22260 [Actinomadura logoneensis]
MTDSNWQLAVLRDLGATQRGLADTAPAEPRPVPAQGPDPAEIAGTAQVPAQAPPQSPRDPVAAGAGGGGFPGLPVSADASPSATGAGMPGPSGSLGPSGSFGSGEYTAAANRQVPAQHADAPVAGPAADPGFSTGPAPTSHTDAPVAGPAADASGSEGGPAATTGAAAPGPDVSQGGSSGAGDQASGAAAGFPGVQDGRPATSGTPGGDGQWGAPAASAADNTWGSSAGAAQPDGATGGWGAPAETAAKPDNAWGASDGGQPDNAWGAPANADNAAQHAQGGFPNADASTQGGFGNAADPSASQGGLPHNADPSMSQGGFPRPADPSAQGGFGNAADPSASQGGFPGPADPSVPQGGFPGPGDPSVSQGGFPGPADSSAQGGFPGVGEQQGGDAAQPLGAPPAADASWGPAFGEEQSGFPGAPGTGSGFGPEGIPAPARDHTLAGGRGVADDVSHQQNTGAGAAGQGEPLLHADFAWEAAINPVLGGGEPQEEPQGDAAQPQQSDAPAQDPRQQAQQAAAAGPHPASELVRRNVHGDRLGKRIGRGVRKAVGGGSAMTAQQQAAFADLMARPVPSFRQIAVASVRGGAGKTTMAALLASELARHRQDRVVAIDADAELGSLPLRLGIVPQLSLFELAQASPSTFEEVSRFLSRTPEGLWVLSSTRGGRMSREFDVPTFQRALSSVSRFVSAAVVDCGAGILTGVNQEIIAQTHALVLVTPGTVDGALSARGALEWFANNGRQHVFQRAVVAMVSHAPQINADLGRAQEMLTAWGLPVVHVPYDRQVATGAALDLDKVGGATRQAATKVVYQAFARSLGLPGVQG